MARLDEHFQNAYDLKKSSSPDGKWVDMPLVRDALDVSHFVILHLHIFFYRYVVNGNPANYRTRTNSLP